MRPPRPRKGREYPVFPYVGRPHKGKPPRRRGSSVPLTFRKHINTVEYHKSSGLTDLYSGNVSKDQSTGVSDVRTYVSDPDWKQKVAKKIDASHPYSRSGGYVEPCSWSGTVEGASIRSTTFGSNYGTVVFSASYKSVLADQALKKLKNKLNSHLGNAQLAAPVAEFKDIYRSIHYINDFGIETVRAMSSLAEALYSRKIRRASRYGKYAAKKLADLWLGFGFGIQPLLSDLQKAADAVQSWKSRTDHFVRLTGTSSVDYLTSNKTTDVLASNAVIDFYFDEWHRESVRLTCGIELQIKSAGNYSVDDHLGLTISDVPGAIWELIPFSWVVDYVSTVGDWVDDLFYSPPGIVKYITQTHRHSLEATCRPVVRTIGPNSWTGSTHPGRHGCFLLTRDVLTSLPHRGLRFKTSDEIGKYGMTKLLNLASVLAQKRF